MAAQNSPLIQKREAVRTAYEKVAEFKDRSNQALYETLAETLGFVKLGLETKNRDEYEKMLRDADLSPRDNSNVYLPAIKLLFRKKNKDGKETPIASAYKYAKAIRYFLDEGITEDMVVEHILGCEFEKKKKLLAIYAKDSKRHRDDRGGSENTQNTVNQLKGTWSTHVLGRVGVPTKFQIKTYGDMVVMAGQIVEDQIVVRAFLDKDEEEIGRTLARFKPAKTGSASTPDDENAPTMWDRSEQPSKDIAVEEAPA